MVPEPEFLHIFHLVESYIEKSRGNARVCLGLTSHSANKTWLTPIILSDRSTTPRSKQGPVSKHCLVTVEAQSPPLLCFQTLSLSCHIGLYVITHMHTHTTTQCICMIRILYSLVLVHSDTLQSLSQHPWPRWIRLGDLGPQQAGKAACRSIQEKYWWTDGLVRVLARASLAGGKTVPFPGQTRHCQTRATWQLCR